MGVSLAEINAGVLETSKVLSETMSLWNQITGKSVATPTIQAPAAAAPAGGATGSQAMGATTTAAGKMPPWAWIAAAGVGLILLMRR